MCGIVGIYSPKENVRLETIKRMTALIRHRGPDDEEYLAVSFEKGKACPLSGKRGEKGAVKIEDFSEPVNLILGHRRLSIIDLSAAGRQPMGNEDRSLWIVHNGEIYNYLEIRKELESLGHHFESQTDTEVILHAYEEWGIGCLKRFNGMWAFAIVDLVRSRIFCSRDRAGVKPFYYIFDGRRFGFASEIKALLEIDGFSSKPNDQIIADYLFWGVTDHTEETFFKKVYQLRPGEYLLLERDALTVKSYWDIQPERTHFPKRFDYTGRFYELLEDSIRLRLRSDVPIGTCLSGGLDSSSIVCLANRLMFDGQTIDPALVGERQKTFSSCFEDQTYDERRFIEAVIVQTGAEKNYVFPRAEEFFKDVSRLIWHQDEPFGSTSIYAQWCVMKLVQERGVKVVLDGQGGDELLGGYLPSFYHLYGQMLKRLDLWGLLKEGLGFLRHHWKSGIPLALMQAKQKDTEWVASNFQKAYLRSFPLPVKFGEGLSDYLYHIFRSMTLPRLLHYEDRSSMAFSVETRLPFLDYRLVEFVFGLPCDQKIKDGVTKVLLRNALNGKLPEEVRNRHDKVGFITPEDIWFRTVLRNQIYEIISSRTFAERGYFNTDKVKEIFEGHCNGQRSANSTIWRCVNLELWFRKFFDGRLIQEG